MNQTRIVLIVDDSPEDRELSRRYLLRDREYSYTILEASSGREGLTLWQQHQPDAVLLDYRLPDLDGLEFLTKLQAIQKQQYLPVIVVTGQGNEAIAVQAMKAGAQDYLVKEQITPEGLRLSVNGAITTVQLHLQLQQRIERERLIRQITQKLYQSLDLAEILQTTVTEVRQFLQTDRVLIFRLQSDGVGTVTTESVGARWTPLLSTFYHDPCLAQEYIDPFRQGLITLKVDIYDGSIDPCHVELLAKLQVRANLVVPILQNGQLWGMLIVHHCSAPRQWQPIEVDLLKELATQVGIALQQAELYQQAQSELAQRRYTELALQENQAMFEAFMRYIPGTTYIKDESGRYLYVNPLNEKICHRANAEWLGKTDFELFSLQEAQQWQVHDLEALAADQAIEVTETHQQADGEHYFLSYKFPIQISPDRRLIGGLSLDITERKRNEEALRQSEEFKNQMLASSPDCIKVLDLQGRLLYLNQGGICLMEIDDLKPYLNQKWVCFWQDEYRQQAEQALATACSGEVSRFSGFCLTAKGNRKWWEVILSPIFDGLGQVERILSISRDISERKLAESERERLLQQEQAARAEAERANQVKDEFLAILSHELRSPLNPILGWAKLMQTHKLNAIKTAQALETIERNAKLQAQLIDDLLDVAKILRGKLSMDAAPVNLVMVVESALDTVRTAVVAKSIVLVSTLGDIGQISGDAARLQQIVWNLLSNAVKFTPIGGRIEIKLEQVSNQAQITVKDTGKGINSEFLPHIFESFRQEDFSTTRKYGGLGLGLAIVRSLVEAHGGVISADSAGEGQGATFIVQFPLIEALPEKTQIDLPAEELDLTGIRVLTIDDEADARELFTVLLSQYGAEVLSVSCAAEVLAGLESFRPHVFVSDIGMPEIDGYALLQQVRSLRPEQGGQIPAIALTAYAREEDQERALAAGFQYHISKPIDLERLVQLVFTLGHSNQVSYAQNAY